VDAVDVEEIKRLGKRFKKLDLDGSGSLSVEEFMSLPELQQNPLVQRVIEIFDTDGNGEVDFKGSYHCSSAWSRVERMLKWGSRPDAARSLPDASRAPSGRRLDQSIGSIAVLRFAIYSRISFCIT